MKTSTNNNKNLEKILSRWRFPEDIIEKYKILGIKEIFDWQYECLSIASISGKKKRREENLQMNKRVNKTQ